MFQAIPSNSVSIKRTKKDSFTVTFLRSAPKEEEIVVVDAVRIEDTPKEDGKIVI